MLTINPYLNFAGNTEEALTFYKSVFGGDFPMVQRFKNWEGNQLPPEAQDKIMHMGLPIGSSILMATDTLESLGQKLTIGNNVYLCVNVDSREQADKIFSDLSAGGKIEMPMQDADWGAYFGCFADKFGVQWMINFDTK